MKKVMSALLIGLFLVACCPCRKLKSSPEAVTAKSWSLIELDGRPVTTTDNFQLMFTPADSSINGVGDCNRFFGKYTLSTDGKVTLSPMGSTRAFCQNQALEDQFLAMLGQVDSYQLDGALLMLLGNGELKAIFKAIP